MNPLLSRLQPYPFERLRQLFTGVTPNPQYRPISLGIGEPKHPTPPFIREALAGSLDGVDLALGFHNYPHMPVGRFGYARGASLAASDRFDIAVVGRSGHAAHPEDAVDPIVAACHLVTQLQTVVSREVNPLHPCVVTVGAIHAGTVHNIIPDACVIRGTVRTLHAPAQDVAEGAIRRLCAGLEAGMRVRCEFDYRRGVPALRNDDRVLYPAVAAVRAQLGDVVDEGEPSLGGEDFAFMAERVPAFHLRVGSGAPGRQDRLHNSGYQRRPGGAGSRFRGS